MRFRTLAIATALAAGLTTTGNAFTPHKGADPFVAANRAARNHRTIGWTAPAAAQLGTLAGWKAMWDRDTDVPLRMWGPSIAVARSTADAGIAEAAARRFLADHLATLAPGASPGDFVVVANQLDPSGHVRSVGFAQQAQGLRVFGGAIGVVFERDHLVMVSSTSLPHVSVRVPAATLPATTVASSATSWLAHASISTHVVGRGDRVIVPIVHERGPSTTTDIEYRVVETVNVEGDRDGGTWDVFVDAADAAPVARRSTTLYASGQLLFDTPDRYPAAGRSAKPAPNLTSTVNGAAVTSDANGNLTWATAGAATITPGLAGPLVTIVNKAGALVQESLSLADGGSLTWSKASDAPSDAQLDTFIFASQVKQFAKTRINPSLAWLDQSITANVNINQTCNAYYNGQAINFFKAGTQCENTGRIADVVYHEFGHGLHDHSIITGVGTFDPSLSEGLADTLAVSITGDPGMGRGFFFNDNALRDLDPVGVEKRWPQDISAQDPHATGEIIGEALYDLRKALQTKLGVTAGYDHFLAVFYGVMQRSSDIPSTYAEALVSDDDDGNLANGTPNMCEITNAFAPHGLVDPAVTLGLQPPTRTGNTVTLTFNPASSADCPPPTITSATLTWFTTADPTNHDVPLAASGNTYSGDIPQQTPNTLVLYHVTIAFSDGSSTAYPQNPADPEYQMWVGPVTTIKCFDFESGIGDWTHSAQNPANDEWAAGPPLGKGGDPSSAHGGQNVLGIDLGADDGLYSDGTKQWVVSPEIDLAGYTNVHLQYYRWLGVEDGAYDNATIFANDMSMWTNHASAGMPTNEVNHIDKEWRFQDVDLSAATATGKLTLKFELDSDQGLAFGGWTMDDVCVVAIGGPGPGVCGNGVVDQGETCDDGNTTDGDGCSATCQTEAACPDSGGGKDCGGGGCCSSTRDPSGAIALSVLTIGIVLRRRRRRDIIAR